MLGKRISEPRKVVSIYDPAFFEFSADQRERYINTRDIAELGDFSSAANKPTVFELAQVKPDHLHLLDRDDLFTRSSLVSMYLIGVENAEFTVNYETINGVRQLTRESLSMFGHEVLDELGMVLQGFARSDTTPFTPPDSYSAVARAMLIRRALASAKTPGGAN